MLDTYSPLQTLKLGLKTQRQIITAILLAAEGPMSLGAIAAEAEKANYRNTFKKDPDSIPIESSLSYHLDIMTQEGMVRKGTSK